MSDPSTALPEATVGLTSAEALTRLVPGQSNAITFKTPRTTGELAREAIFNVFNFDLFGVGLALWLLGHPYDALFSISLILFNVGMTLFFARRSRRQLEMLTADIQPEATVIRDGAVREVHPDTIVPGDAVVLGLGDQVFADGPLIGESTVVLDETLVLGSELFRTVTPGEQLYAGSYCMNGHGVYAAEKVGTDRRVSAVMTAVEKIPSSMTPLQKLIRQTLTILRLLVVVFVGVVLWRAYFGEATAESYEIAVNAVTIIFGIAPGGIFFMILATYAAGAAKIGQLGVIIRRAEAVETLAQTDVICLGKTGTLTGPEAELVSVMDPETDAALSDTRLRQIVGSFARSATTQNAILQVLAETFEGTRYRAIEEASLIALFGWQGLVFDDEDIQGTYVLGSEQYVTPLLAADSAELPPTDSAPVNTLLFATSAEAQPLHHANGRVIPPSNLQPLARIIMRETVRSEAQATTQAFLDAGMKVKILSSFGIDDVVEASKQVGLLSETSEPDTLSGRELAKLDGPELIEKINQIDAFGRLAPRQKGIVVAALRQEGALVTMLGESVFEMAAMRAANLSISMQLANQAAMDSADIVVIEDSISVLPDVLALGQGIFNRLLDALKLSLTHALMVVWLALIAVIFGTRYFPYETGQNAIVVIFTITLPSIGLSYWLQPGRVNVSNLRSRLFYFIIPASLTLTMLVMIAFLTFRELSGSALYARTAVTFVLIGAGLILVIFVQPPTDFWVGGDALSGDWRPLRMVVILYGAYLVATRIPFIANTYHLRSLYSIRDIAIILAMLAAWTLILRGIWRLPALRRWADFIE